MSRQHKEQISKHKIDILKRMVDHANATDKNEIPLSVLKDNINDYNNAQKLRYHGLIFKIKRGTWGITRLGGQFLRGEKDIRKWVLIEDNHIVARSPGVVNIRHVYQGSTVVATTFEYYEDGQLAGIKPLEPASKQVGLFE